MPGLVSVVVNLWSYRHIPNSAIINWAHSQSEVKISNLVTFAMMLDINISSHYTTITFKWSRGEICVANSYPLLNGASQGNYFLPKSYKLADIGSKCWCFGPRPQPYRPLFGQNFFLRQGFLPLMSWIFFSPFCLASPEIIGVKV